MNHWDNEWPDVVPAGKDADVYMEWYEVKFPNDDAGEVDYQMEGTDLKFRISASHRSGKPEVYAQFKNQLIQYHWFWDRYVYLYIGNDANNIDFKQVF